MSNTGKIKAESSDAKNGSIQKTTWIYTAGDQLTEAGQQLKIGEFTGVSISLKTAGQHLIASGLSGPGNLLIAAGNSFAEVAGSQPAIHPVSSGFGHNDPVISQFSVGSSSQPFLGYFSRGAWTPWSQGKQEIEEGPGTEEHPVSSAAFGHPEIQRQPGTSVGSSQPWLRNFSPGAWNQGKQETADSEPTLEFNELTFSEAAGSGHSGGSLPGSEASHSSSGSGSDSSDRDGEVIVGSHKPPSFLKNLRRR